MSGFDSKFIVIDGPDGCGKSTQSKMLVEWIQNSGSEVVTARDPGGTLIGEKIRDLLLDTRSEGMGDNVEVMLYMASRAQLWIEVLQPALRSGKCVVLDRWLSSTCAYQGYAGGFGIDKVLKIAEDTLERVRPDLTVILDVDLETAAGRMNRQLDRMELKGKEYHTKVRKGFLEFAESFEGATVINGAESMEQVHSRIIEEAERLL